MGTLVAWLATCQPSAPYDEAVMQAQLDALASPDLDGRAPGTPGDVAARAFIAERFRRLGLEPGGSDGSYEQPFRDGAGKQTANVVGYLAGAGSPEIVVVGAHHDHLGERHLGANDNASGVVALLAIAQAIHARDLAPRRTIVFVAFGAEEQGMLGSAHYVAHAPAALPMDRVVYYVNLDMVGSYASRQVVHALGTLPGSPGRRLVEDVEKDHPKLSVGLGGRGFGSDHEPFCRLGVPYVFFWTPDDRCYHQRCDTAERIDRRHLAEIASLAGALVERLADSDVDLAASRRKLGCR